MLFGANSIQKPKHTQRDAIYILNYKILLDFIFATLKIKYFIVRTAKIDFSEQQYHNHQQHN